jgi:hypothetical protein
MKSTDIISVRHAAFLYYICPPWHITRLFSRVGPPLAGSMSPLSVASSPRHRGRAGRKEFHNTDTVIIDPFSKVQPRLNLRAFAVAFGESRVCETLSCLTSLAHFVIQASWHASMTAGFAEFLVISEAVMQGIFMLEICIKIYAAGGFSNFASSIWRLLELTVIAMSFSAFAADICKCPGPTNLFIVAIKSLVHLRLVRLLVMETGMHHLCNRFVKGGSAGSASVSGHAASYVPERAFATVMVMCAVHKMWGIGPKGGTDLPAAVHSADDPDFRGDGSRCWHNCRQGRHWLPCTSLVRCPPCFSVI